MDNTRLADMSRCPDEPRVLVTEDIMDGDRKIGDLRFLLKAATAEKAILAHLAQDASYANFWYTHLSECILEAGASYLVACEAATRIMKTFFGVDVNPQ